MRRIGIALLLVMATTSMSAEAWIACASAKRRSCCKTAKSCPMHRKGGDCRMAPCDAGGDAAAVTLDSQSPVLIDDHVGVPPIVAVVDSTTSIAPPTISRAGDPAIPPPRRA
jgi:hypothetical protein